MKVNCQTETVSVSLLLFLEFLNTQIDNFSPSIKLDVIMINKNFLHAYFN